MGCVLVHRCAFIALRNSMEFGYQAARGKNELSYTLISSQLNLVVIDLVI